MPPPPSSSASPTDIHPVVRRMCEFYTAIDRVQRRRRGWLRQNDDDDATDAADGDDGDDVLADVAHLFVCYYDIVTLYAPSVVLDSTGPCQLPFGLLGARALCLASAAAAAEAAAAASSSTAAAAAAVTAAEITTIRVPWAAAARRTYNARILLWYAALQAGLSIDGGSGSGSGGGGGDFYDNVVVQCVWPALSSIFEPYFLAPMRSQLQFCAAATATVDVDVHRAHETYFIVRDAVVSLLGATFAANTLHALLTNAPRVSVSPAQLRDMSLLDPILNLVLRVRINEDVQTEFGNLLRRWQSLPCNIYVARALLALNSGDGGDGDGDGIGDGGGDGGGIDGSASATITMEDGNAMNHLNAHRLREMQREYDVATLHVELKNWWARRRRQLSAAVSPLSFGAQLYLLYLVTSRLGARATASTELHACDAASQFTVSGAPQHAFGDAMARASSFLPHIDRPLDVLPHANSSTQIHASSATSGHATAAMVASVAQHALVDISRGATWPRILLCINDAAQMLGVDTAHYIDVPTASTHRSRRRRSSSSSSSSSSAVRVGVRPVLTCMLLPSGAALLTSPYGGSSVCAARGPNALLHASLWLVEQDAAAATATTAAAALISGVA